MTRELCIPLHTLVEERQHVEQRVFSTLHSYKIKEWGKTKLKIQGNFFEQYANVTFLERKRNFVLKK